jgi:hypothetical protein
MIMMRVVLSGSSAIAFTIGNRRAYVPVADSCVTLCASSLSGPEEGPAISIIGLSGVCAQRMR